MSGVAARRLAPHVLALALARTGLSGTRMSQLERRPAPASAGSAARKPMTLEAVQAALKPAAGSANAPPGAGRTVGTTLLFAPAVANSAAGMVSFTWYAAFVVIVSTRGVA